MSTKRRAQLGMVLIAFFGVPLMVYARYNDQPIRQRTTEALARQVANFAANNGSTEQRTGFIDRVVAELRARGQSSVDALVEERARMVAANRIGPATEAGPVRSLDRLIDRVAAQRFASVSRLYWHTSLESALEQSAATGLPVLSLRMLGRLDQDLSCANSRFFRTTLYSNPQIADRLRSDFVLHWAPVRDVPIVTIDFGDGRKLRRPLTGNSLHMVMTSDGAAIDVLPGLESPNAFEDWLRQVGDLWAQKRSSEEDFQLAVAQYHRSRAAARRATSELAIGSEQSVTELNPLDQRWLQLAERFQRVDLAPASIELLTSQRPRAEAAMPLAATKSVVETPMLRMVREIRTEIARDTALNLFAFQTKIDDMFAASQTDLQAEALVRKIYLEVFLMPLDDPWLGLSPDDEFIALRDGGRIEPARQQ